MNVFRVLVLLTGVAVVLSGITYHLLGGLNETVFPFSILTGLVAMVFIKLDEVEELVKGEK